MRGKKNNATFGDHNRRWEKSSSTALRQLLGSSCQGSGLPPEEKQREGAKKTRLGLSGARMLSSRVTWAKKSRLRQNRIGTNDNCDATYRHDEEQQGGDPLLSPF